MINGLESVQFSLVFGAIVIASPVAAIVIARRLWPCAILQSYGIEIKLKVVLSP